MKERGPMGRYGLDKGRISVSLRPHIRHAFLTYIEHEGLKGQDGIISWVVNKALEEFFAKHGLLEPKMPESPIVLIKAIYAKGPGKRYQLLYLSKPKHINLAGRKARLCPHNNTVLCFYRGNCPQNCPIKARGDDNDS